MLTLLQVDIDLVKDVTLWALYTKQISLTDVFRYSNVYVGTSRTTGKKVKLSTTDRLYIYIRGFISKFFKMVFIYCRWTFVL